jgi:molecular chaperone GrpE
VTTDNDSTGSNPNNADGTEPSANPPTSTETKPAAVGQNGNAAEAAPAADELATLRAERDKIRDQLLRTTADFDNFRKRSRKDLDDAKQRSRSDLIVELLPVFDNLERALQTAGGASDMASVVEGVRMVLKLFEDTTERLGLVRVPTTGQRFDPAVHDAIQQKETAEHPPGTVIAEIAPGYRFGERLVRPAMVVVARKPAGAQASHPPAASNKSGATGANGNPSSTESKDTDKPA